MDRRRYLRTVALAGAAAGIAGCTGGDGDGDGDTPTEDGMSTATEDAATETPTSTEGGTETPTETASEEPPSDPDQRVAIENLSFNPEDFEISVGDTVLWEWNEGGHNIKYDDGDVPEGTDWNGTEGSRTTTYGEGHVHWHTFETPGEYAYYCVPHQSNDMRGSFTVTE